jgi:glycosyltransferase involved in cell wall biosynthesis
MTEREISTYFGKDKESTFKQYGTRGEKIYKEAREKSGIEMQDLLKEQSELEQQRTHLENQQANILDQHGNEPELSEEEAAIVGSVPSSLSANEKKLKENKAKQDGLYKKQAAENPEALTAPFQTTEQRGNALEKAQKSGKPLPASVTMDTAGLKKIQESIVRSMTEGFSPANTSGLINALSKNNNLKEFEDAVVEMKKNPQQFKDIKDGLLKNTATLRYFRNNPGKATIDYKKLFDITDAEEDAVLGPRKKKGKS